LVIACSLVPDARLTPSLFAANKANLTVLGDTLISFSVEGHQFEAEISVSEHVDEFLLGSDWLEKQGP